MADQPSTDADLNSVPYTAPLSFKEPSAKWIHSQNHKGTKRTHATVPAADLRGKWVIISGSNNGIGREAAVQMAAWGANLILACREPPLKETHPSLVVTECRAAARVAGHEKAQVEWWELDCASLASAEAFCARWLETGRALDILCNNAGIGSSPGGRTVFRTKDGFEIIHQVNFLSHVLLTLRLLPSLAAAPTPRIVCTTSCFHYLGKFALADFNGELGLAGDSGVQYYQNNKLYFQIWLAELQRRLLAAPQYRHVTVNGVHPGYVNTGIWNLNQSGWLTSIKIVIVKVAAWLLGITPQQGSLAILHGAVSVEAGPDPEVQGVGVEGGRGGGRYFNRVWEEEAMPHARDQDCRLRVWRKVNDELGLEEKGLLDVLGLYL
ncbi:putative ww domain-containing oxidoreductase isoform 1 protein [Neofusicoccum parvum]|uniref:Ww domain-containing oxidoreductase isoform 1 protein n=1 Tax=Neofusicoccum parvum TaxID=310453 RepID=A0ACB5RYD9_9PEZI|nr:putative ww domain-containing oxidoreductase isoform 1 protein [Neofusicoccum parvum]